MTKKVTFYDPHPGYKGAMIPLPKPMKEIADILDGQEMNLEEAVGAIESIANQFNESVVKVVEESNWISFQFEDSMGRTNGYRLLRYK